MAHVKPMVAGPTFVPPSTTTTVCRRFSVPPLSPLTPPSYSPFISFSSPTRSNRTSLRYNLTAFSPVFPSVFTRGHLRWKRGLRFRHNGIFTNFPPVVAAGHVSTFTLCNWRLLCSRNMEGKRIEWNFFSSFIFSLVALCFDMKECLRFFWYGIRVFRENISLVIKVIKIINLCDVFRTIVVMLTWSN